MNDARRKERRHDIQNVWDRLGGKKGTWNNGAWIIMEEVAKNILTNEGYSNVVRLTDTFPNAPFDIRANNGASGIYVFQVTNRTHQDDYKRHTKLAELLGLNYRILYINPSITKYIIKSPYDSGCYELTLADLKNLKEVVR